MYRIGVDVSSYQGKPDWNKVAADNITFAILRILNSKGVDTSFEHNYAGCTAAGIEKGVYRYSYALTVPQAQTEALEVVSTLAGRSLDIGVWLDLEWSKQRALGNAKVKEIADAWMQIVREHGYKCGVYCNLDWYRNVCGGLNAEYWVARYPAADNGIVKESLRPNVGEQGWQFSSKGKVAGISGNVDMNIWYGDIADPDTPQPSKPAAGTLDAEAVRSLQEALNADGVRDRNGNALKVDGAKGTLTESAIKKVLLKSGAFNTSTGRYTVGSTGQLVKWLQMRLNTVIGDMIVQLLGTGLTADGKFGSDTRLAVGLFQESRGLKQDYLVGVNTVTELLKR